MSPTQRTLFLAVALFASSIPGHATDWPTYQRDLEHTGQSPAVIDAAKLMPSWAAPDGYATPLIVGDTIYSTKSQGGFSGTGDANTQWASYVSAFDLATGAIKWTHSGNNVFGSQAAIAGGLVVFYGGQKACMSCATPTPDALQLVILDAATGAVRYKVDLGGSPGSEYEMFAMPLLVPDSVDGSVMAYCAGFNGIWAVRLGPTNGSVVWIQGGNFGRSMPTLAGDAVLVGGVYQLFAFNRFSGAPIPVNNGGPGGPMTPTYDSIRQRIYYSGRGNLTAYRYVNGQIDFLWGRVNEGIGKGGVGIGPSGKVYVSGDSKLLELDPDTGTTLRSVVAQLSHQQTPAITAGIVWGESDFGIVAYDLETMQPMRKFTEVNWGSWYYSPGAFADDYFVMARGDTVFAHGFKVWARPTARPLNISTRLRAQSTSGREMYAGFIIAGSDPKQVCIRALGPSLQQFGIAASLPDPSIELHDYFGVIGTNNNWKDTQAAEIQASGLAPSYDSEAAMIITLNPGAYTAIVRDAGGGAGVGLVEVYDQGLGAPVKLANISTRGFVESAENVMIAGFILGNEDLPALVVIRAIGPSLAKFGTTDFLPDPVLELHDANGVLLQSNDNWRDTQEAQLTATGLAPEKEAESAMIATLPPSAYTAIVAGKNGGTGIGVVEVYHVR